MNNQLNKKSNQLVSFIHNYPCEEHIKSLERAKSIILSAYILDMPNELSLIRSRIIGDIEQGITHYKEWIKKHSDLP